MIQVIKMEITKVANVKKGQVGCEKVFFIKRSTLYGRLNVEVNIRQSAIPLKHKKARSDSRIADILKTTTFFISDGIYKSQRALPIVKRMVTTIAMRILTNDLVCFGLLIFPIILDHKLPTKGGICSFKSNEKGEENKQPDDKDNVRTERIKIHYANCYETTKDIY